jgi:hypothetical protein
MLCSDCAAQQGGGIGGYSLITGRGLSQPYQWRPQVADEVLNGDTTMQLHPFCGQSGIWQVQQHIARLLSMFWLKNLISPHPRQRVVRCVQPEVILRTSPKDLAGNTRQSLDPFLKEALVGHHGP